MRAALFPAPQLLALLLAGSSASLGAAGCSRSKAEPTPGSSPSAALIEPAAKIEVAVSAAAAQRVRSVVLITVDALRADQPWTGYQGVKTPHLSQLASESVVYTRAYSLANTTAASIGGLLNGRYPTEVARDFCILARYDMTGGLVALLKKGGVHTFAAHGHALFVGDTAPLLGFDEWRLIRGAAGRLQSDGAITSDEIADLLIAYIAKADGEARHFIWAHFVDPHDAYVPHAEFPASAPGARPLYDGEVAYTDRAIGRVLASIESSRLAGRTAVVVTADHGEAFGEHSTTRHGFTLYEEEIHIPLIVHVPGVHPKTVPLPRSAVDLAPTISELLGQAPSERWRGVSLLRDLDHAPEKSRFVIVDSPEMVLRTATQAVISNGTKVVVDVAGARAFDLQADPGERSPLSPEKSADPIAEARRRLALLDAVRAEPCGASAPPAKIQNEL